MRLPSDSLAWRLVYQHSRPDIRSWQEPILQSRASHSGQLRSSVLLASQLEHSKVGITKHIRERARMKMESQSQNFADLVDQSTNWTSNIITTAIKILIGALVSLGIGTIFFLALAGAVMLF